MLRREYFASTAGPSIATVAAKMAMGVAARKTPPAMACDSRPTSLYVAGRTTKVRGGWSKGRDDATEQAHAAHDPVPPGGLSYAEKGGDGSTAMYKEKDAIVNNKRYLISPKLYYDVCDKRARVVK